MPLQAFPLDDSAGSPERLRPNGADSLSSSPARNAVSSFHGGSEEVHWSVDGHEEEIGLLNRGGGGGGGGGGGPTRGTVVNVESPPRSSSQRRRRISVSFDESKAARRQRILEQVCRRVCFLARVVDGFRNVSVLLLIGLFFISISLRENKKSCTRIYVPGTISKRFVPQTKMLVQF